MAKKVTVRVLSETKVDGKTYKPNNLVSFEPGLAKSLEKEGQVDSSPGGVAYCKREGVEVVEHGEPEAAPAPDAPA